MRFLVTLGFGAVLGTVCRMPARLGRCILLLNNNLRGVAQLGSAPALGAGGPRFESGRPDLEKGHALHRFPPLRGISLLGADRLQVTSRLHKLPAHGLNRGHRTRLVPGLGCHPQPVTATQSIRPQRSPNPKAEMPQAVAVLGLSVPCRLSYVAARRDRTSRG